MGAVLEAGRTLSFKREPPPNLPLEEGEGLIEIVEALGMNISAPPLLQGETGWGLFSKYRAFRGVLALSHGR
jgi:hypothetical protein